MLKKTSDDTTDRKSHSMDLLTPRRSPNSALPLHTHRSSAPSKDPLGPFDAALLLCGALELVAVLWRLRSYCDIIIITGCLPSLSLTSIGLRCTLEGGRQASYQPSDASTPKQTNIFNHIEAFSFTY